MHVRLNALILLGLGALALGCSSDDGTAADTAVAPTDVVTPKDVPSAPSDIVAPDLAPTDPGTPPADTAADLGPLDAAPDSSPDTPPDVGPDVPVVPPKQLILTEIMADPERVADETGEWIELYNGTDAVVNLEGWTLKDDGSESHKITTGGKLEVAPGAYVVLAASTDVFVNGGVPAVYGWGADFRLSNTADEIVLLDPLGAEVERFSYDDEFPVRRGLSMGLTRLDATHQDSDSWCLAAAAWPSSDGDRGTPGAAHLCGEAPQPPNDGCPNVTSKSIDLEAGACPALAQGLKLVTIRPKHDQWILEQDWVRVTCPDSTTTYQLQVSDMRFTTWAEVTPDEYQADGFGSHAAMMSAKQERFPGITNDQPATVYRWNGALACPGP